MARTRRRARRRNPASSQAASAFVPSERVTLAGSASRRASDRASARPVPRPRPDRVASDRASARAASKKSKASAKAASVPASRKKSALPMILGLLGGAAVIGGVAWWLLSKKAQAAEGERTWSDLSSEEKSAIFQRQALMQKHIKPLVTPFNKKDRESEKARAEAQGLVYFRAAQKYVSPDVADQLVATGDYKYDKEGVVVRAHLQSLSDASRSIIASL